LSKDLVIIGAGASGLTTALAFQLFGYKTKIYTKQHPFLDPAVSDFSSYYPAASIIPHSVNHPDILDLFNDSNSIFEELFLNNFPGIEKHSHYEFFSIPQDIPDYAQCYPSFELFDEKKSDFQLSHPTLESSFGWFFDCLFSDWSSYYPLLLKLYQTLEGELIIKELNAESIIKIDSDIIINCAEIYGATLLGEEFNPQIYRGHLLHIPGMPSLRDSTKQKISYNFTPETQIYSSELGSEQDVYFYQRDDRWIFGGSRQKGTLDERGNWIGEQVLDPTITLDNKIVPEQILELNKDILNYTFESQEIDASKIQSKIGYRFMGNSNENLRLDCVEYEDKLIINNFGHGGSGVTLSWGCALRSVDILHKCTDQDLIDRSRIVPRLIEINR
jgi:glycine/D-amino acid oxidase-like deaminating enzyme